MALPTLTPEQRENALNKARETRRARSTLLASVKSGETTVAAVLDRGQSDPIAGKIKVTQLLRSLPGYGAAKGDALMREVEIDESRRVNGLGTPSARGTARGARLALTGGADRQPATGHREEREVAALAS